MYTHSHTYNILLQLQTAEETTLTPCEALLWGRPVLSTPTYPKLGREVRTVCSSILSARNPAALSTEKRRLLEMAGSVERLYDIIRYYKWSHTLCTWRYPEVLLAQEQAKARHMQGLGVLGSTAEEVSVCIVNMYLCSIQNICIQCVHSMYCM